MAANGIAALAPAQHSPKPHVGRNGGEEPQPQPEPGREGGPEKADAEGLRCAKPLKAFRWSCGLAWERV